MTVQPTKNDNIRYDVETARESDGGGSSQLSSGNTSTRIVNAVPGSNLQESGLGGGSSTGSGSLRPVQLQRRVTGTSVESSDGFSLVDDAGDSLPGSDVLSEGSQSGGSSNNAGSSPTGPPKELSSTILSPSSFRAVRKARFCFWIVWLVGTISVTTSLWATARDELDSRYDLDENLGGSKMVFQARVALLQEVWYSRLESKLQAIGALSTSMTSNAMSESMSWPFVTIPDFARRTATLQSFTFWMPFIGSNSGNGSAVSPEIWGSYARENAEGWLYDRLHHFNATGAIHNSIFETGLDGSSQSVDPSAPYYLPVWQNTLPPKPSLINYDLLSDPQIGASIQAVIDSRHAVLSPTFLADNSTANDIFLNSILSDNEATAFLFYPIFGDFSGNHGQSDIVGVLGTAILWDKILKVDSVGGDSTLKVAIPLAECTGTSKGNNESLWMDVTGKQPISVYSNGDSTSTWGAIVNLTAGVEQAGWQLYMDAPGACDYALRLVENQQVHSDTIITAVEAETNEGRIPINIVTGVLVLAFSLGLLFWRFDRRVQYRDLALTMEANRTRKIVTSLFPPQFHDRLFQSSGRELSNGLPNIPEFQKIEEFASGFFGMSTKDERVPEAEKHAGGYGPAESLQQPTESVLSASNDFSRTRAGSTDSFAASNHSKQSSFRRGIIAKTASMRSMRKLSGGNGAEPTLQRLRTFIGSDGGSILAQSEHTPADGANKDEPIADLFPDATVMFADISGFTAWSSAREPAQVFKLLETLYRSFDRIARKRKVFKVETIGDCYVAVTGLPEPQPDHAVIMSKFAKECMAKMRELTRKLEVSLGPETGDLCMRFGLHSGPVTAGVLRGEKSRFQLFGDTVNYASRMESTGLRNRIQGSQATADLLIYSGRANWIQPREELVNAKGKGQVQTYWINPRADSSAEGSFRSLNDSVKSLGGIPMEVKRKDSSVQLKSRPKKSPMDRKVSSQQSGSINNLDTCLDASRRSMLSSSHHSQIWTKDTRLDDDEDYDGFNDGNRQERLIEWNVKILAGLLKRIVAWRQESTGEVTSLPKPRRGRRIVQEDLVLDKQEGQNALDEIREIIPLASTDSSRDHRDGMDTAEVELPSKVENQLHEYVTMIACMYRDNCFHNFEHASHVLMSAQKLLKRVITAEESRSKAGEDDYTSIIASDPLTQFAIVFAALIHDVDHTGVPNAQLVKEQAHVASLYKNKSIAEQNSLDLAWDLLMSREYRELQRTIFATQAELQRFRQLVVNVVLATDIFDPDMIRVRNSRWEKAFGGASPDVVLSEEDGKNLKATIVIEYIMQASDVSHTMQHWQLFQKWNERLFIEIYSAYQVNRGDSDPSIGWYKGELWFFDNYIIPLAEKLKECGVFGAASDQCLNFALGNRREWANRGEEIVEQLVRKHSQEP